MLYFPFTSDQFVMTLGARALAPDLIIEVDVSTQHTVHSTYQDEIALKRDLLTQDATTYLHAPPATEQLQWETIAHLLPGMARRHPAYFTLTVVDNNWVWHNHLLQEEFTFRFGDTSSLPLSPLDWLGRQLQEDLLLLDGSNEMPLLAGQVCFPNGWCLTDKLHQPFHAIHDPVPNFAETIGRSTTLLLQRIKIDHPVWRVNWTFNALPRLNLIPQFYPEEQKAIATLTPDNIGTQCLLRVERQTLSRLPASRAILFTVHTYQTPISSLISDKSHVRRMVTVLRTTPAETLRYKGMEYISDMLISYLEQHA